ncbi:dihydrofolate reductase family protein [Actinomadura sp. DC4]|uniref:dihydrofolate reductase family protein n=1 Tax=Actinomadura sp. DC4 TaxID=3055069 RepID=UPI0025AF9005|nr:dihydrofolate reductase family protein [Actinomadura sp. DC4]MDN3354505.1 dihydrofolate reductase family protein [Actinomadura sp. DC4]
MAKLIYSAITSLDGYVADADGKFDWSVPDAEVMAFLNEIERPLGTYLYGRRMYEVMSGWETAHLRENQLPASEDFTRLWQAASKVVYSRTLDEVTTSKTRLEREFDPGAVRAMKEESAADMSVGGSELAGVALKAGVVDEVHLYMSPILVGGGKPSLPDDIRLPLELLQERRFGNGVVYVRYRTGL